MITPSADAHAADLYYHANCYTHLRDLARAEERTASAGPSPVAFSPIVIAQIVALVESSDSVFMLSSLRQLYRTTMDEQATPCPNAWEPHATRFKKPGVPLEAPS